LKFKLVKLYCTLTEADADVIVPTQGALLSLLLTRPVLLRSIVVGGGGPYSASVLERAIIARTGTTHRPALLRSSVVFPESRYCLGDDSKPCPSAVLWAKVSDK
jgi:hypothetical protein